MLDSQDAPNDFDTEPAASNAPEPQAFATREGSRGEVLHVTGASWAEYHLLLGESSHHCTRIESEIRTFGGAPTIAILLARWCAENPGTARVAIGLSLTLGQDPNARLLRRELGAWQGKLPNLRVHIQEDASAPEVAYRILMWPQAAASTWGEPQVLEHGEIGRHYRIGGRGCEGSSEMPGSLRDVALAASAAWAAFLGCELQQRMRLAQAAARAWENLGPHQRIACALSWSEVEAQGRARAGAEGIESI